MQNKTLNKLIGPLFAASSAMLPVYSMAQATDVAADRSAGRSFQLRDLSPG